MTDIHLPNYDEHESFAYSDTHRVSVNRRLERELFLEVLQRLYDAGFREPE